MLTRVYLYTDGENMKNEFALAFNEVLEDKGLPKEVILQALEAAMVSAYRRAVMASTAQHVEAKIDPDTGKVLVYAEKEVVDDVEDERTEVSLNDALKVNPDAELGGMVIVESTPKDFGRVAAQTARQVISQRIREAERDAQYNHFNVLTGDIVSGVVQAITNQGLTLGLEMKAEASLPRNQQVPGERFRVHDRIQALLLEVKQSPRGPQIILSRSHRNFLRRLLENEVPEIYHGLVEIRSIAREPGQRSKVAVAALQPAVDPVGACVGIRGVRIQAIVRELNDEKIDVIEWNPDPAAYIAKALSPARVNGVYLNEHVKGTKTATVVVPEDQLSLAIGRDGQNARLAAKLTGWRIDIKSLPEAAQDALHKLQSDPDYAFMMAHEEASMPALEAILGKKAEGRPVTPEEYQLLSQFVDRVERGILRQRGVERMVEEARYNEVRATIPDAAFSLSLEDLPFSTRVYDALTEAGYDSAGSVMLQMQLDSDAILALVGLGPKSMAEIKSILSTLELPQEQILEEPEPVIETSIGEIEPLLEEVETQLEEPLEVEEGELASIDEQPEIMTAMEEVALEEVEGEVEEEVETEPLLEEVPDLEDMFTLKPDEFIPPDEEEEDGLPKKGKKAKKKKKYVEMEYDPDRDVVVVRRKRKRSGSEWEDGWEY